MRLPGGYRITGVRDGKTGLGLICAPSGMKAAGIFTNNANPAEPVKHCRAAIKHPLHRAILVNRGSANAATGEEGRRRMLGMLGRASGLLGIPDDEILPASTGVIGRQIELDPSLLEDLISRKEERDPVSFAEAIMTTDTVSKLSEASFSAGGGEVALLGAAKGAGMICPDMATMLAFIITDADMDKEALDRALRICSRDSFNALCVDGETSTNDSVFLCASGVGEKVSGGGRGFDDFCDSLGKVCSELASRIAADGEGATKSIKITVTGALSGEEARKAARAVAASPLCKTAFYGASPNWGRIISAIGAAGISVELERFSVSAGGAYLVRNGRADEAGETAAREVMAREGYSLDITVGSGSGKGVCHTCDLSPEYVAINAGYLS